MQDRKWTFKKVGGLLAKCFIRVQRRDAWTKLDSPDAQGAK